MSARRALLVLTLINLVNYLDRYVVSAALPAIQAEFGLSATQGGLLGTAFIVAFMVASPLGGYLGDRVQRRALVGVSVVLWSLATLASGLAGSFTALLAARAAIGIGEAGYGAVAPALISDLYRREERAHQLAVFYTAMPVGSALGFLVGGALTEAYSWNAAFFAASVPGLLLGLLAFRLPEPHRGAMDGHVEEARLSFSEGLRRLARNRVYWTITAGYTLATFSIGGLAVWMPSFLVRERGFAAGRAGLLLGVVTLVAGLLGTLSGGWLGRWMERRVPGGGLKLAAGALLLVAPLLYLSANVREPAALFATLFAAQFLLFLNAGPISSAIVNSVPPASRAFAMGLCVLCIHLLGDALSPTLIGAVADASSYELAIELNALPLLACGVLLLAAARRVRAAMGPSGPPPGPPSAPGG